MTGDDYSIQDAIDSAGDVDTVVVYQGVYEENLLINKSITLTSLASFDTTDNTIIESLGDDWIEYNATFAAWEVANELINSTIIDGSGELKSTITIGTEDDICIEPIILGFTIQDGAGTLVYRFYENPDEGNEFLLQIVGGGVLSYLANPTLHYNKIQNNGIEAYCSEAWDWIDNQSECDENGWTWLNGTKTGSGIYAASDSDDIGIWERTKTLDRDCGNDIYDFKYNFFEDNYSSLGRHIGNRFFQGNFDLSNCVFDFWNCEDEGDYQTPIWVNIDDIDNLVAENEENSGCLYFGGEVYVDPVSGNDDLNDGLSWEGAFYTITHAIASVVGTEENPVNIHLAEGVYSPSTNGEIFPIEMISYVNLIGQGEEVTILDAQQTDRVITMENCENNILSGLTITGGYRDPGSGGGMVLINSDPLITDIAIQDNSAEDWGGGIYLISSNPTLVNITVDNNNAIVSNLRGGGGIAFNNSSPIIKDAIISNNSAYGGGGLNLFNLSAPILSQVIIVGNSAYSSGGGIDMASSKAIFDHVLIYENTAYNGGGLWIYVYGDAQPIFNHVTISNNSVEGQSGSGGIWFDGNTCTGQFCPKIINSIIYGNTPQSIVGNSAVITYSNVAGGYAGDGNINSNPYFNAFFSLQDGSPCIDAGHPNPIYKDLDLSRADMGFTGGSYLLPTFTEYDFGEVGTTVITENWYLYNFRNTNLSINSASFQTQSFYTDVNFPLIIESLDKAIIPINAISLSTGVINDNMVISGPDIPDGSFVDLVMTAVGENVLSGNLSGQLTATTYRITGNLTVDAGETLYISPGTTFLFDGEYSFTVYGILKAQGNEQDSIIFSNYNLNTPNKWKGFSLENVTEETIFEYVRISGALTDEINHGGGINLWYSHPILANITISGNISHHGGGIYGWHSNPTIIDAVITDNIACHGGGIYLWDAEGAQLIRSLVANNNALPVNGSCGPNEGGGLYITGPLTSSNSLFIINSTISDNVSDDYGDGIFLLYSSPVIINSIVWNNGNNNSNSNIYTYSSASWELYENTIIADNNIGGWNNPSWTSDCSNYSSSENPLFTDSQNGDYSLQENSPCIDAGTAYFECDSEVILDIDSSEYFGLSPDLGAYENNCETYDECGVCGGDGSSCEFVGLNFSSVTSNSLDIVMDNPIPVAGFQMVLEGIEINSISGGSSSEAEFSISFNNSTLVGFTLTGDYIPPGDAVLFHVEFTPSDIEVCFQDVIVSDINGVGVTTAPSDCSELCISGDLNCDSLVNIQDIIILVNIILGVEGPDDAGDLNSDGLVNIQDIIILVNIILTP